MKRRRCSQISCFIYFTTSTPGFSTSSQFTRSTSCNDILMESHNVLPFRFVIRVLFITIIWLNSVKTWELWTNKPEINLETICLFLLMDWKLNFKNYFPANIKSAESLNFYSYPDVDFDFSRFNTSFRKDTRIQLSWVAKTCL